MKLCLKIFAIAVIAASTYSLSGCATPSAFTYQNIGFSFAYECTNCPLGIIYNPTYPWTELMPNTGQGGVLWITAYVTNAPPILTWKQYPTPNLSQPATLPTGSSQPVGESGSQIGTIQAAGGNTAFYAQNGVPVYTGQALLQAQSMQYNVTYQTEVMNALGVPILTTVNLAQTGIPQGDVLFGVSVPSDPANPSAVATGYTLVQLFNNNSASGPPSVYLVPKTPTNPSGLTTSVVNVPRNGFYAFYGGVVGASPCLTATTCGTNPMDFVDTAAIWEVGGASTAASCAAAAIQGGSTTYGTISTTGVYTAPAAIPSGFVCIVMAAHIQPSVTAIAYITIS